MPTNFVHSVILNNGGFGQRIAYGEDACSSATGSKFLGQLKFVIMMVYKKTFILAFVKYYNNLLFVKIIGNIIP